MNAQFEVYKDEGGEWRFRLVGANGEIVIPPEGHPTEQGARTAVTTVSRIIAKRPDIVIIR